MLNRKIQAAAGTAVAALAAGMSSGGTAHAAGSAQDGWVRLAHLSPNTPPVDVYLYAFGGSTAQTVLKHVAYGTASSYEALPQGLYTVAMRAAGADAGSAPVISTNVDVKSGAAYTVAGLGPTSALTLSVLNDQIGAPAGEADVRVIEASLQNPSVTVSAGGQTIAGGLRFPTATGYRTVAAGALNVAVTSDSGSTTAQVDLNSGSSYTLAILDGTGNAPRVLDLTDSVGSAVIPKGGVAAGYGGTSHSGIFSAQEEELLWGGLLLVGATGAGFAVRRLLRF